MTKTDEAIWTAGCAASERDRRNQYRFLWATLVWAVVFVGATFLTKRGMVPEGPLAWLVAALPTLAALLVIWTYARFLREGDELQRVIQLRSLALGFGAAWVATCGYPLFEHLGAPPADAGDYFLVMAVAFTVGNVLARRQYR
ncbi:MAG: hypothetical protein R3325_12935 [Thermoanaerobaculia bacterium]|nr:hypothetical protein [Thermoanaerobaculia bacterium]